MNYEDFFNANKQFEKWNSDNGFIDEVFNQAAQPVPFHLGTPDSVVFGVEDRVNSPSHYTAGNIECIEAIEASMTPEAFRGYCKGNVLKYLWRYEKKGKPLECLEKSLWYLERLKSSYQGQLETR